MLNKRNINIDSPFFRRTNFSKRRKSKNQIRYSQEVKERAIRMVFEQEKEYHSMVGCFSSIALRLIVRLETLRTLMRQAEQDQGIRSETTSMKRDRIKELERENRGPALSQRNSKIKQLIFA